MTSKSGANKTGYDPLSGLKLYLDMRIIRGPAILPHLRALTSARSVPPLAWWGGIVPTLLLTAMIGLWSWIERARIVAGAV